MIKKIIFLAVLVAAGYVGYRIWTNLSPSEKAVVSKKLDNTVDGAKKLLDKTADKLTDTAKDAIEDMDKNKGKDKDKGKDEAEPEKPAEKKAPDEKAEAAPAPPAQ